MSLFVGIAVAMVAAALAWILVPLLRGTTGAGVTGEASNVAVLRDQMHELETDLRNGTISRENYELARQDLERRALEESKNPERTVASMPSRAGARTAALVAGALPIAAMLIYVALGNFEAFSGGATAGRHDVSPEQIAKMIKELEGRLEKDPGNAEGWSILARTYYPLNRFPAATRASEHATALRPADAQLLPTTPMPSLPRRRNAARQAARTRHAGACRRSDAVESTRPCRHRSIRSQGLRAGGGLLGAHEGIGASRLADRSINRCKHRGSARTGRPEGNNSRNGGGDAGASRHGKGAGRSGSVDSSEGARCQRVSRCRGRDGDARPRACGKRVAQ
jgi:cytochrome c-type biogenesis protein CcmI